MPHRRTMLLHLQFAASRMAPNPLVQPMRNESNRARLTKHVRVPMRLAVVLATAVFVTSAATANDTKPATDSSVEVVRGTFGLFNPSGSGQLPFVPTNVVPFSVNQAYGWIIVVKTSAKTVRWREEFTLPAAPRTWGGPEPIGTRANSDDGRTTITEREVSPQNGVIFNTWAVAAGDPTGSYRMRISINGRLVHTFEFQVK